MHWKTSIGRRDSEDDHGLERGGNIKCRFSKGSLNTPFSNGITPVCQCILQHFMSSVCNYAFQQLSHCENLAQNCQNFDAAFSLNALGQWTCFWLTTKDFIIFLSQLSTIVRDNPNSYSIKGPLIKSLWGSCGKEQREMENKEKREKSRLVRGQVQNWNRQEERKRETLAGQ